MTDERRKHKFAVVFLFPAGSPLEHSKHNQPRAIYSLAPPLVVGVQVPSFQASGRLGTGPSAGSFLPRRLLHIPKPEAVSRPSLVPSLEPFLTIIPKPSSLGQLPYTCFSQVDHSFSSWLDPPSYRSHLSCSVTS